MRTRKLMLMISAVLVLPVALLIAAQQPDPQPPLPVAEQDLNVVAPPGGELDCDPAIVPRWQTIEGRNYVEWAEAWWQWLVAFPPDENPVLDPTGQYAGQGQSPPSYAGPMYFLTGTFGGGPVVRDITIASDKYILVTPLNCWWDTYPGLWNPLNLPDPLSIQDLRAICAWFMDRGSVSCTIDGREIRGLRYSRLRTSVFSLNFDPEFATFYGYDTPYLRTAVGDGWFVILRPLDPGQHVIHFTGEIPDIQFVVDVTYNITVVP
ncbi:MAG: hypothetical protein AB1716_00625 [Planctomycetota bacterium]